MPLLQSEGGAPAAAAAAFAGPSSVALSTVAFCRLLFSGLLVVVRVGRQEDVAVPSG